MAKSRNVLTSSDAAEQFSMHPKMQAAVSELDRMLQQKPTSLRCPNEEYGHCLRRWLRAEALDAKKALKRIEEHNAWWQSYGMDNLTKADELDENGVLFVCGQDHWSRPTLIARPAPHDVKSRDESLQAARKCVYAVHAAVQQMPSHWEEQKAIVIYDCIGLRRQNLDLIFAKEVAEVMSAMFPERLERVVVINSHWTMQFFWAAVKVFLHRDVVAKVSVSSGRLEETLLEFVPQDHPYLRYAVAVQKGEKVDLPRRSSFPLQGESETKDLKLPQDWSRQSTGSTTASTPTKASTCLPQDSSTRFGSPIWVGRDSDADSDFESVCSDGGAGFIEAPTAPVRPWWETVFGCCTTGRPSL